MPSTRALALQVLAITVVVTVALSLLAWPAPVAPNGWFVGDSFNDQASIAWTLDFVARRLAGGELPWGHTDRLLYPEGGTLWPVDLPEAVLVAPVTRLLGPVAAFDLLALLHHGLVAGFTWAWLRREGADAAGAATGAAVMALAPALVVSTWNGNPDVTPWYWIPAALWASRRPLLAGALVGMGGACSGYVGVMGAVALGLRLAVDRRWRDLALAALPAALIGGGTALATLATLDAADALIHKQGRLGLMGTASVLGLLRPWPEVVHVDPSWAPPRVGTGAYLGLAALLAGALARDRRAFGWTLVVLGAVAALGPELRWMEAPAQATTGLTDAPPPVGGGTGVPLPWALVEHLPGLDRLHQTARYTGLCALGLAWLASRARARWVLFGIVVADLLLLTGAWRMFRASPRTDDGACAMLATLPEGPVADLPPTFHEQWLLASTCHGRPVAEGINQTMSESLFRSTTRKGGRDAPRLFAEAGFRWLVLHPWLEDGRLREAPPDACRAAGPGIDGEGRLAGVTAYDLDCLR